MKLRASLPRSLFARIMLIWLAGITLVLSVSLWLYLGERSHMTRQNVFEHITGGITTAVRVLERLPASEREAWLPQLEGRRMRFQLAPPPSGLTPLDAEHPAWHIMDEALPGRQVALYRAAPPDEGLRPPLWVSLVLTDGQPLSVELTPPPPPRPPIQTLAALAALILGVILLCWIGVRQVTRPLARLADAALALGKDLDRPPLPTDGPDEVARAASAFNNMQADIRAFVAERTRILAAISHDLQTPLTRLRLRAEMVDDPALAERIGSDIDTMQALIREGMDYARSQDSREAMRPMDLNALLSSLCAEAEELGHAASLIGQAASPYMGRPNGLKRALWNLMDNGLKFGDRVDVELKETDAGFLIRITDHGPGMPEQELEKVFEPFYRLEASRNRETGGTGLGLAIARNLLGAQGGEVRLANRKDGKGLEALVSLPRQAA